MGYALAIVSTGTLVGPPLAGFLVEHFGVRAPFFLAAGLAAADGVVRTIFVRDMPAATDDPAGPLTVLRVPGSRSIVAVGLLGAAVLAVTEPVLPLHLAETQQAGADTIGLLFGVAVLAGVILTPIVGGLVGRIRTATLVGGGAVLGAVALLGIGQAQSIWQVGTGMVALGATGALLLTPAGTLIGVQGQRSQPPALGGAYALFNFAYAGGLMIGPLLSGIATGAFGFAPAMAICAAATAGVGILSTLRLPAAPSDDGTARSAKGHIE